MPTSSAPFWSALPSTLNVCLNKLYGFHPRVSSKRKHCALTGVAQLVGHHPAKYMFAGSIPSQGMGLGCGSGPQLGCV